MPLAVAPSALWERASALRRLARRLLQDPHEASERAATLAEYLRLRTLVLSRAISLGITVAGLAMWPLDRIAFREPGIKERLSSFRLLAVAGTLAAYVLLRFVPVAKRFPGAVLLVICAYESALVAATLGDVGAPERPLLYSLYVATFATLAYAGPLLARSIGTFAVAATTVGVLVAAHPTCVTEPMFPNFVVVLCFACSCGIFAGQFVYLPTKDAFFHREELRRLNADLEARVQARTEELRALSAHLSNALENERIRLAREIHDELAQSVATMRLELDLVEPRVDDPAAIARLHALLDATQASLRRILSALRPRILDDVGLGAALEWLADEFRRREPGIACAVEISPPGLDVSAEHATALFRIVQECLSNVSRHARASRVRITLARRPDGLELEVADDGRGIAPGARRADAMGLLGMKERAWQLAGALTIDSKPGAGTRILVRVPERPGPETEVA